jgi:tripartite-type tricarboxylate transporter receptor subunit TctC
MFRYSLMLVSALSVIAPGFGQEKFPTKVVTIVGPFPPPGGGTDTGARLIAQKLTERWGLARRLRSPVTLIAELPLVLLVNPALPAKSAKELIALANSKPKGEMTYSSSGSGGSMHLAGELFQDASGVQLLHVPCKGGGPALVDLMAGHVNLSFATILESIGFIKGGKLRALAVTSDKRFPALPDVPTLAESGLPGYNSISWIGLLGPREHRNPSSTRLPPMCVNG